MALTPEQQKLKDDQATAAAKLADFEQAEGVVAADIAAISGNDPPPVVVDPPPAKTPPAKTPPGGGTTTPPPVDNPPPTTTVKTQVTGIDKQGVITGTAAPEVVSIDLQFDGSEVNYAVNIIPSDGAWSHQLPMPLMNGKEHTLRAIVNTAAGSQYIGNANRDQGYDFTIFGDGTVVVPPPVVDPPPVVVVDPPPVDTSPPPVVIPSQTVGNVKATVTAIPYPSLISPLAKSKHLCTKVQGKKLIVYPKDCPQIPGSNGGGDIQDGNNTILGLVIATNIATLEQDYWPPDSTKITAVNPDDAFTEMAQDENGVWWMYYFFSTTTRSGLILPPAGNYATPVQPTTSVLRWRSPDQGGGPQGTWEVVGPWPWIIGGDRAWRALWDNSNGRDRFIIPINYNGAVWGIFDRKTMANQTKMEEGNTGNFQQYGDYIISVAGIVKDVASDSIIVFDLTSAQLMRTSLSNPGPLQAICQTQEPKNQDTQAVIKMAIDPDKRVIVISSANHLSVYEIATGALTTFPPKLGFFDGPVWIPCSDIVFDPNVGKFIGLGGKDWNNEAFSSGAYYALLLEFL